METRRLPRLLDLLKQRPHGKALLKGECEGILRFYQSRQGILAAAEFENIRANSSCILSIDGMELSLPLCGAYGCVIFLFDDCSLHELTGKAVTLSDRQGTLLAEGIVRSWDSL